MIVSLVVVKVIPAFRFAFSEETEETIFAPRAIMLLFLFFESDKSIF